MNQQGNNLNQQNGPLNAIIIGLMVFMIFAPAAIGIYVYSVRKGISKQAIMLSIAMAIFNTVLLFIVMFEYSNSDPGWVTLILVMIMPYVTFIAMADIFEKAIKTDQERVENQYQTQEEEQEAPNPNEKYWDFEDSPFFGEKNNDDFYGADKKQPEDPPAPRGFEQRHPDDVHLWAKIDDPECPEGEQLNALRAINRRKKKR